MLMVAMLAAAAGVGCALAASDESVRPAPFRPAWWCRGANQQTILSVPLRPVRRIRVERRRWDTPDGDFVDVDWLPGRPGSWIEGRTVFFLKQRLAFQLLQEE